MKEDLKSLKEMKGKSKEKTDDSTNYLSDDDLYMMMGPESSNSGWVMDCAASMHICKDRCCFDALQVDGDFGHVIVGNGEKMKIEGVGTARLKTHNGIVKKLSNVRYVPTCGDNIISLGELCSRGYKFIGDRDLCKIFKDEELILQGVKSNHHIFRVDDLKEDMSCQEFGIHKEELKPKKKQVRFSDEVIELGTLSRGRICWDISSKSKYNKCLNSRWVRKPNPIRNYDGNSHSNSIRIGDGNSYPNSIRSCDRKIVS